MNPRASVLTPTYRRPECLPLLYRTFRAQTYPDKELLILDDGPEPVTDPPWREDPSVRYFHSPVRLTIGEKRNRLAAAATGEVLVHFDDDDYYAPGYIDAMVTRMGDGDLITLGTWFVVDRASGFLYYWDAGRVLPVHYRIDRDGVVPVPMDPKTNAQAWIHQNYWGYGFSYVYTKPAFEHVRFDATRNKGEDYDFVQRLMKEGRRAIAVPDESGLALHVLHRKNTASVFPNHLLPGFLLERIFGPEVVEYLSALRCGELWTDSMAGTKLPPG